MNSYRTGVDFDVTRVTCSIKTLLRPVDNSDIVDYN